MFYLEIKYGNDTKTVGPFMSEKEAVTYYQGYYKDSKVNRPFTVKDGKDIPKEAQ